MSVDSVDSDVPENETFAERLAALKDIVPPTTRHNIATKLSASGSFLKRSGKVVGNIVWVLTTSALLVGLPMALSLEGEAAMVEQEKAMLAQGGQQVCASGIILRTASSCSHRCCLAVACTHHPADFPLRKVVRVASFLLDSEQRALLAIPPHSDLSLPAVPYVHVTGHR